MLQHLIKAAQDAHNGTSFSPERRGANLIEEAEQELSRDLAQLPESAHERYAKSYERHLSGWIGSKSRCVSSMIAGPSNFPARRMMKYNDWENSAYQRLQDFRRRAIKAIQRAERGPVTVSGELAQARQQLASREAAQAQMKRINEAHKKYMKAPEKFDFTSFTDAERQVIVSYVARYSWEPHPYAPYGLTNNNAQIRRYKDRVAELEAKEARQQETPEKEAMAGPGWRIIQNNEADRIQIIFDEKPPEELRKHLKSHGFKWAPSANAWQRKLTGNAIYSTRQIIPHLPT